MQFEIIADNCVACLACVRACPAAAIAVEGHSVEVVDASCVRCGACVPACPHHAVEVVGDLGTSLELAARGDAVLLLSVEAEVFFHPRRPEQLVNACYRAGFRVVHRGVLGDELVAAEYEKLWAEGGWGSMIRSTCPVVVDTITHRYPQLAQYLAPVKTPVAAEVDYVKACYGDDAAVVYAGVCLGDGGEGLDAVITLEELAQLLEARGVNIDEEAPYFIRMPGERRRHVSMPGGMPRPVLVEESHASRRFRKIRRDLGQLDTLARAVERGLDLGFVDILPCEGCLDHPLMGPRDELFWRRSVLDVCEPPPSGTAVVDEAVTVDVRATFVPVANGEPPPWEEIESVIHAIGTAPEGRPWNCGACGYTTCTAFAEALLRSRATYRQCPPYQERRAQKAHEEAATDELTGLATFRVLRDRLQGEMARSARSGDPFGVLFVDLDDFKGVNDRFGHEAGNRVLRLVADVLRKVVRSSDVAVRYGGDEFVVVLMGTNEAGARRVAEEVRRAVEASARDRGFVEGTVTVSVGVTGFDPREGRDEGVSVLEIADRALYAAKAAGGNRVV